MATGDPVKKAHAQLDSYELHDRYTRTSGRVFLTGTQALVALLLLQRRADDVAGLNTAGFVSGYPGSPLGGVDATMHSAKKVLDEANVDFLPAINEDLAATAVCGTQQVEIEKNKTVDGVFGMWCGKGCGADRSGDAMKHGNAYGSSENGGVLAIIGDDHGCVSSTMSQQSDFALKSWYMPVLNPANLEDYLSFGLWGYAVSRYSGAWVGFKAISETVESAASVELPELPSYVEPTDYQKPETGLNLRYPDLPGMHIEQRLEQKMEAVKAFARANPIDRTVFNNPSAKIGIVTSGKAYPDLMEALALLGIDESNAAEYSLDVYKVGLVWPLETEGAAKFAAGKDEVLIIEEKRDVIEEQLKADSYNRGDQRPGRIVGKKDEAGNGLVPDVAELSPSGVAPIIAARLEKVLKGAQFEEALGKIAKAKQTVAPPPGVKRTPYFCSGCPHNSSTKVPEGSRVLGGTGCHFMTAWMEDRRKTDHIMQMGGEGINWLTKSMYIEDGHTFQNLGDGTYSHSGIQAIRQAVAAKTNITYKILYNDAVAMTGGQDVAGYPTVPKIASNLVNSGVGKVTVVSDEPERTRKYGKYPENVAIEHRDDLDTVQRDLREISGVTALIYDQTCAAEKRRRRKRGKFPDPAKRMFINDLVCEGCGDCSVQSNCLSIVPKETEFGRKRKIDQASCNKDYSCANGFCPSFVSIEGGELKKPDSRPLGPKVTTMLAVLPDADVPEIDHSYNLLVGGVGGTGIVTVGAILSMAAHLEGKGTSVQDYTGIAQKGGSVFSYVRFANTPEDLNQIRIDIGSANAVILADLVVGNDPRALGVMRDGGTQAIVNTATIPTADFVRDRNMDFQTALQLKTVKDACGEMNVEGINAIEVASWLLGDTVFSNILLLGMAWQKGLIPVSANAIYRAMELNGKAVEKNKKAFDLGRVAAIDPKAVREAAEYDEDEVAQSNELQQIVERRAAFLIDYQNQDYSNQYQEFIGKVEQSVLGIDGGEEFAKTVAKNLFKLMAYKDEYEVARLHTDGSFKEKIAANFTGDYKVKFHMAPPIFNRGLDTQGRPKKTTFGPWMYSVLSFVAKFRSLRGTAFDVFGYTEERKMERHLISDYKARILALLPKINEDNISVATEIANVPDQIRGYGPVKEKSVVEATQALQELESKFSKIQNSKKAA